MFEYGEDYYERGIETGLSLYSNYRWMPERTIPFCHSLIELLGIKEDETILDFGCAMGYVVKGFRLLHRQAWGVEISEYAVNKAPEDVRPYIMLVEPEDEIPLACDKPYTWCIVKDVLEHIEHEELSAALKRLRRGCKSMYVIVPLGRGEKYNAPAYDKDITHIIRECLVWWSGQFANAGFTVESAKYLVKHLKDNWESWAQGNGFFLLR